MMAIITNANITIPTLCKRSKYTCQEIVNPIEPFIAATKSRMITIANANTRYILPKPRENHHHTLPWITYKIFPAKDQAKLTAYSGPLMGTSNECRKYSVTSDAISNGCWHDTVTGSDFDLIAHGQVRIMPQGWENLLRQCKGFVSREVA